MKASRFCPVCGLFSYGYFTTKEGKGKFKCSKCGYIQGTLKPNNKIEHFSISINVMERPVSAIEEAHARVKLRAKLKDLGFNGKGMSLSELQRIYNLLD